MCLEKATVPSDYFRKDIRYHISVTCILVGNHESKTFLLFWFSLDVWGKLGVGCVRVFFFFFFGLHLMLGGKLCVGRRKGLVVWTLK